jgi:hypothetical protein
VQELTIQELLDRCLRRWKGRGLSEATIVHYANTIRLYIRIVGERPLTNADLSTELIDQFGEWLRVTP